MKVKTFGERPGNDKMNKTDKPLSPNCCAR